MKLGNFSQNLSTVNFSKFSKFSKFASFDKSKFGVASTFLMKSTFSQNQIFNKIRNSYTSFFLVSCLTPFEADITFITLLLPKVYVYATSYRLFNVPGRTWCYQQKGQHILKINVINVTKLIFKFSLCQVCFKIKQILNNLERVF